MRLLRPENASKTLIHAQIAAGFFVYVLRYEHITKKSVRYAVLLFSVYGHLE